MNNCKKRKKKKVIKVTLSETLSRKDKKNKRKELVNALHNNK